MRVYRLCGKDEARNILEYKTFENTGHKCQRDALKNTHQYMIDENYMHFFQNEIDLLYLNASTGKIICVYDIPNEILNDSVGKGNYLDFINFKQSVEIIEYAIQSKKIRFEHLKKMYIIQEDLDFDYVPTTDELYKNLSVIYNSELSRERLKLQYADAKAHHPDKVEKRIEYLDYIKKQLKDLEHSER